jgi:hypothetical protein
MNNSGRNDPDPSTILHLHKFSPAPPQAGVPEPETGLTAVVKSAAQEFVQKSGAPTIPREGGELPAKEMLGAVSYCYAKGVYTSEEIERKMMRDSKLRESVHGNVPSANAIRRFRALNRGAIQQTLEKVFRVLWKKRPSAAEPKRFDPVGQAGENTVSVGRREAAERLDQAAFIDNMSKD